MPFVQSTIVSKATVTPEQLPQLAQIGFCSRNLTFQQIYKAVRINVPAHPSSIYASHAFTSSPAMVFGVDDVAVLLAVIPLALTLAQSVVTFIDKFKNEERHSAMIKADLMVFIDALPRCQRFYDRQTSEGAALPCLRIAIENAIRVVLDACKFFDVPLRITTSKEDAEETRAAKDLLRLWDTTKSFVTEYTADQLQTDLNAIKATLSLALLLATL
jgi:hypothetical protein